MTDSNLSQDEVDSLLASLLVEQPAADDVTETSDGEPPKPRPKSLLQEIQEAILDSGKLSLREWKSLRERLAEIEALIPHIDFIIELKAKVQ